MKYNHLSELYGRCTVHMHVQISLRPQCVYDCAHVMLCYNYYVFNNYTVHPV